MKLFRRRRKAVVVTPERVTAEDLGRMAADGRLARTVETPPPAPRASADRVRETLAVLPVRPLGAGSARASNGPDRQVAAAVLLIDDEQRVTVTGPGLIGRDPSSSAAAAGAGAGAGAGAPSGFAHVIALADEAKLLSRTHLEFGFGADGALWVLDTDSANGVELRRPGYPPTMLPPRQRTVVQPDDVVGFGGHVLRIEPATGFIAEGTLA